MNSLINSNNIVLASTNHPLRVLIVDDHELFRHGLRNLIKKIEGFEFVAEASSCKEALSLATIMHFDLVMLDMYLPDGDGIQVTRQLKQEFTPSPRVVILSAMVYENTLVEAILVGADGYLTKDMTENEITKALKCIQQGELALLPTSTASLIHLLVHKYKQAVAELATYQQDRTSTSNFSVSQASRLNQVISTSSFTTKMLTPQEAKVFQHLRYGQSNKQIATQLSISPYTVGKHVQNILRKLGVTNRTQAVAYTSFEGGGSLH